MIIPDQSHINRVRDALWQRPDGCASVMVGAGFSRNALKAGPQAREFPLWHEIARSLCEKLYPLGDGDRFSRAMAEASGTSGFLRLAQEYEAAFGRGALHRLIQVLVPDDDYIPGDIHARLLRLPWRDVFTTNWDTLLERTRSVLADQTYGVVRTPEEIPSAPKPRIVKLHGSFPAHIPFIFTEEDYRTYPKRFSPFVNTVQQSMMETVFFLIGFSGDDPNFLHWSGWVRDNLGELAPKIYLAGWLNLSPHRRRMLEERSVVPIDLARHPQADSWPEHLRHRYATEWILHTLERGRPYEVTNWPFPQDWKSSPVPEHLQPVEAVTVDVPVEGSEPDIISADPTRLTAEVRAIVRAWKHNRNGYPGWLFFPPSKHYLIGRSTNHVEPAIFRVIPDLTPLDRLSVFRELVWRRENLLEPLSQEVESAVQAILDNIDCQTRQICGTQDHSANWDDIRESWRYLAMALLTAARRRFDRDSFEHRLAALTPFLNDHPDVPQWVYHEKCLWALYAIDYAALEKLLKEWRAEGCDPVWMTRKAAILVEMDRNDEAVRLLNRSLSIVREAPRCGSKLASPSCEGWTLWLALAFELGGFFKITDEVVNAPPAFQRWKQLASLQCDALAQKRDLLSALQSDPEKKDGPHFDLGVRRGKKVRLSNDRYDRWIAAHRAVRMCEVAGLPPLASNTVVASDILRIAVERLVTTDYTLASRLALRLARSEDDATFNSVWSRFRIAAMPMEEIGGLVDLVTSMITYALPRAASAGPRSNFWMDRLRVFIEALSRLVLRLPPERAEAIFKRGLKDYRSDGLAKHHWFGTAINHLLTRSWEAVPTYNRAALALDIMSAPIAGLDGFEPSERYPDPGELLIDVEDAPAPDRTLENEGRWTEIIQLIIRGLRTAGRARQCAALRTVPLVLWGRLSAPESELIAKALWHSERTRPDSLPIGTTLLDWMFLLLPEPEPGLAEQRFRRKWLVSQELKDEEGLNEFLWHAGNALMSLRGHGRPLVLTDEERTNLVAMVEAWIKLPATSDDHPRRLFGIKFGTDKGIIGLQFLLSEIDLSTSVIEALFTKVSELNQTDTPGFRLYPVLSKFLPDRLDEIAMSMRMGLASDSAAVAEGAVLGLHVWLTVSKESSSIPVPPGDLLREIGMMIATRRKGVLNRALQAARWIFSEGSTEQRNAIAQPVLHGLSYLLEELRYDREHGGDAAVELPLLRWGCAHLALAMSVSGYNGDPTVALWAEVAKDDPLPEVRHAECPVAIGKQE